MVTRLWLIIMGLSGRTMALSGGGELGSRGEIEESSKPITNVLCGSLGYSLHSCLSLTPILALPTGGRLRC